MPEELRHLIPKNRVIYRLPKCEGYYGFTDKGTRVEDVIPELCCVNIITENYREHGVVQAYGRWFQDLKDTFPHEFEIYGKDIGLSKFLNTHYDELNALRKRFLYDHLGFTIQPDPEYFDLDVTGEAEAKSAVKQSLKKGVKIYDLRDYISYLRDSGKIAPQEYHELHNWIIVENYSKFKDYETKVAEVQDSDNEEEEEEDIMSSTKITATTSAGTPKNPVIYKCIDGYYEGYTNNGNKVEDEDWVYCGRDIIIHNYADSGMDYNDACSQFISDVKEYDPDWSDSHWYDVCYSYLYHIGFRTELDPEQFPMNIRSESELKDILRSLMLAGAEENILDEYIKRLHYVNHVLDWGEYMSISTWLGQKFNTRSFSNKISDIAREMYDDEEEDDIMSSTRITASYVFNYDVSGEDDVKTEVTKALQHARHYDDLGNSYFNNIELHAIYKYLDELCYDREQLTLDEYDNILSYIRRFHRTWYQDKYQQFEDEEDSVEEDDNIISTTKITASTNSAGTPNEPVIYEKAGQQGFYGYSNSGKKVTAPSWDRCAMNIVLQNYMESGMSEEDARYQFWQDVKDFNPEAMIERCGGDLDVRSEEFEYIRSEGLLNELRFEYLVNGLDFYDVLDQNIFDYRVSNIDEVKHLIKKAMLAGAELHQYYDYFSYLLNSSIITQDEYDELCDFIDNKFEDRGFRVKNYARLYENNDDEDEEDVMNSTKIKENKIMGRKFTKKPRYFANMVSAGTDMSDERLIILVDGDGMDGCTVVFETNAPKRRLSALERECQQCDYDDMPNWVEVLTGEGYTFTYVDECQNVTPYTTSSEWLEDNYPDVTEMYYIDCN